MSTQQSTSNYYSEADLQCFGFKSIGRCVKISKKASIYNHELISIGDHSRIDDFCCVSGLVTIGRNCHVTPFCLVAGGKAGIWMNDYSTLAYRVSVFSQSDDYYGNSLVNSTIPAKFKCEKIEPVVICSHVVIGAHSVVLPGVTIAVGTSIGAQSLVTRSTEPWGIYYGSPARRRRDRSQEILNVLDSYLESS